MNNPFLDSEWMSSIVGVTITYIVFVLGILPTLISQALIPESIRNIYMEKMGLGNMAVFWRKIYVVSFLLVFTNPGICRIIGISNDHLVSLEMIWPSLILGACLWVLCSGTMHVTRHFESSKDVWKKLTNELIKECASGNLYANRKAFDSLALIAKEIPRGSSKNDFIIACEKFAISLFEINDFKVAEIAFVVEELMFQSIVTDNNHVNAENVKSGIDSLFLISRTTNKSLSSNSYINTKINLYICQIGLKSLQRNDLSSFMYATDKLALIEGAPKEMYALGDAALKAGYMPQAVTMVRNLSSRVRKKSAEADLLFHKDRHSLYWLGLIARIYHLEGWAQNFAERQLTNLLKPLETQPNTLKALFDDAQIHFYKAADFSSADAVLELQKKRYPATLQSS